MYRLIPPPISKNKEYHESAWDTRNMPYNVDIIRKTIKDSLTVVMQEEVKENFGKNYRTIPTKEWINILGTLENRHNRMRIAREYHKSTAKKKNYEQLDGDDAKNKSTPRFTCNKRKPNHGNDKKQNSYSHHSTQRYCVLFNNT